MHLERGRFMRRASLAWEEDGFIIDISREAESVEGGQWDSSDTQGAVHYKVPW